MVTPCSVSTCTRSAVARGFCKLHYKRWKNHGDPTIVKKRNVQSPEPWNRPPPVCKVEGCFRKHFAFDLCNMHWFQKRRMEKPKVPRPPRLCGIPGCKGRHYGRGFCLTHYHRWRRTGVSNPPLKKPNRIKLTRLCKVQACMRRHHSRGWCVMHYERWLKHGDPLKVLPKGGDQRRRVTVYKNNVAKMIQMIKDDPNAFF